MAKITVLEQEISLRTQGDADYISLTDIARYRDEDRSDDLIRNWLRNRNTLEFLGIWEQLYNPDFNSVEFDGFRNQAGLNSFTLSAKQWIEIGGSCVLQRRKMLGQRCAGRYDADVGLERESGRSRKWMVRHLVADATRPVLNRLDGAFCGFARMRSRTPR